MSERYLDTKLEPALRAQALLEELSLEEKIAQINCVFPFDNDCNNYKKIAEGTKHGIGEVSTLEMRRMETLEDAAKWKTVSIIFPLFFIWKVYAELLSRIQQVFRPA